VKNSPLARNSGGNEEIERKRPGRGGVQAEKKRPGWDGNVD